jgi:PAS domain S-box-containing protein
MDNATKFAAEGTMSRDTGLPISLGIVGKPSVAPNGDSLLGEIGDGPDPRDWLVAIINGSDDAIISKDLNGNIRTWNASATRLFGYSADEVVGKPITILIPEDRLDEEPAILAEIRRGNRVDHFETVRRRKDGSLIDLSLTISPVRNAAAVIVGASKIARDITEQRLAREKQKLLYGEMQYRVKNLFAITAGIVSLSARSSADVRTVVESIHDRLGALARAHDLTMPDWRGDALMGQTTTLLALVRTILQPYAGHHEIVVSGDDPKVGARALTHVALLLHELATNAAKYGCLAEPEGRLAIHVVEEDGMIALAWKELCKKAAAPPSSHGFGTRLEKSVQISLGANIQRDWLDSGLAVRIEIPAQRLAE